jgi:hypothetical protein
MEHREVIRPVMTLEGHLFDYIPRAKTDRQETPKSHWSTNDIRRPEIGVNRTDMDGPTGDFGLTLVR